MLAEWNAECSADAPTIVVPWSDAASGLHFLDLRAEPYDIAEIAEADATPALGRALRALNATRSPLLTSKCDTWEMDADELASLTAELDFEPEGFPHGFAGYIDFLWRDRSLFASSHQQRDRLDRLVRRAERLEHPQARLELTLRPALLDRTHTIEGFGVTLYLFAAGVDAASAAREWELALEELTHLLRSRDFEVPRTSATID